MEVNKDNFYDPAVKDAMKSKIRTQIEKMRTAQAKGDMEAMQKIMILQQRIKLIDKCRQLDESRISNLQKLFKHYCAHRQKPNKPMSFDEINFQYQHLTVERFFIFIADFKLNQIPSDDGSLKQLTDRSHIILIFKKASSNARLLNFHEFIIGLERLFVLLFNQTENYDKKQQKLQAEKKKRLEDMKKRQAKKLARMRRKKGIPEPEKPEKEEGEKKEGQSSSEEDDDQSEEEDKTKQAATKKSQKTGDKNAPNAAKPQNSPNPQEPKSTENDQIVKDMMKDFQLVNPTDEVKNAVKEVKKASGKQQKQQDDDDNELEIVFDPYQISDEEKIESYMQRIHVDNPAKMEKKMRRFEKANHRFDQVDEMSKALEIKKSKMQFLRKDELTHYENGEAHEQWSQQKKSSEQFIAKRMKNIKQIITQRQIQRSKSYLKESIPKEVYEYKTKKNKQSFIKKQKDHMFPNALARLTKMQQDIQFESKMEYSLDMINRSTPNQLPFGKINPERYAVYDPSDRIFLQEFSMDNDRPLRGMGSRGDLVESTKRRAKEIEVNQTTRMNKMAENKLKNPHYLQKFLQRKW